ncbi:Cobalt-zinc-cadmium resistance protein CzcD [Burkholderia anthina]|nr:Cobalt-zinc-cadmium resistance protein CzcD [Burkholderia anthina]
MNEFNGSPPGGAHSHAFPGAAHARNERKTWLVIGLCTARRGARLEEADRSSPASDTERS